MSSVRRDGAAVVVELSDAEFGLLTTLVDQYASLLGDEDESDPALRRLFPDGYRNDPDAQAEFRRYTRRALREHKTSQAGSVAASLAHGAPITLSLDEAEQWLPVLTGLRLVLAERIGIRDEDDEPEGMPGDVYHWLGGLQFAFIDAVEA